MAHLQALSLLLLASLAASVSAAPPPPSGYRFELTHIDSKGGFTRTELMRRAAHRSRLRAAMLSAARHGTGPSPTPPSSAPNPRSRVRWSGGEYLMELGIGTPPVPFAGLADTGSDLIWTQSQPCNRCFPQSTPIYDPKASSSFSLVPCSSTVCRGILLGFLLNSSCAPPLCRYHYEYGDHAYSEGVMGTETLTFRSSATGKLVSAAGVAFGCGNVNVGASFDSTGTVGLGRGPLSLVAQLGFGKFSYCLTTFDDPKQTSPLLFGSAANLTDGGSGAAVQMTPLVQNPQQPSAYYVSLEGISLGDTRLPIPRSAFEMHRDGTGGVVVDSGTTYTMLEEKAFKVVVKYVGEAIGQPGSKGPCYLVPSDGKEPPTVPDMTLHFAGGADMRLSRDNYMYFDSDNSSILCLAMTGARGMSILGNFQQQNVHVLYDITEGLLSFVPADCSKL